MVSNTLVLFAADSMLRWLSKFTHSPQFQLLQKMSRKPPKSKHHLDILAEW